MPLFVHYALCARTPVHNEPIKAQTANLGVSALLNEPTNEQLPCSHQTYCKDDWVWEKEGGWGSAPLWYVMITATGLSVMKMMRYFPIVPWKDCGRPFVSTSLQCFEERKRSHEAVFFFRAGGEEEEEEWGELSHIWRPEMEQNSMSNIWNSNCIM